MDTHTRTDNTASSGDQGLEQYLGNSSFARAFVESLVTNRTGKESIADYVVSNLIDSDTVILDAGSTSYEIARAISRHKELHTLRIYTNNLAAALCLVSSGLQCHLIGGRIDEAHFCTLPTQDWIRTLDLLPASFQAIVTAAAVKLTNDSLVLRARKPDQFEFKKNLLSRASSRVIAIDHTKWLFPFDGQYEFPVTVPDIKIVVDQVESSSVDGTPTIRDICVNRGYTLYVAS